LAGVFETFGDGGRPGIEAEAEAEADGDALMDVRLGFGIPEASLPSTQPQANWESIKLLR
jgi:hypothetical protein